MYRWWERGAALSRAQQKAPFGDLPGEGVRVSAEATGSGYPHVLPALLAHRSYRGATTVWAFVVALLVVLVAGWCIRRRR
jgi:hypothetical protein